MKSLLRSGRSLNEGKTRHKNRVASALITFITE